MYIHNEQDNSAIATALLPDADDGDHFAACVSLYVKCEFSHSYWTPEQARAIAAQLIAAADKCTDAHLVHRDLVTADGEVIVRQYLTADDPRIAEAVRRGLV